MESMYACVRSFCKPRLQCEGEMLVSVENNEKERRGPAKTTHNNVKKRKMTFKYFFPRQIINTL